MNTKNRKLPKCLAAIMTAMVLMVGAYETTAMASGIGMIDAANLLDIHADADMASEVVGQVIDEGHVVILERGDAWIKIQAGDILGWVPAENLIETEISHEEAAKANEEMFAEMIAAQEAAEEAQEIQYTEEAELAAQEEAARQAAELAAQEAAAQELARQQAEIQAAEIAAQQAAEAARIAAEQAAAQEAAAQAIAQAQAQEAYKQQILAATGVTDEELKLLASIIYCEAKGEPYVGKVAVGSVVLNRVRHPKYPNTISDVIYAKNQFTPVRNGSLKNALEQNRADASCYQAALEALTGVQPVGDKIFFRRVNGRAGQVIGHHVFY